MVCRCGVIVRTIWIRRKSLRQIVISEMIPEIIPEMVSEMILIARHFFDGGDLDDTDDFKGVKTILR